MTALLLDNVSKSFNSVRAVDGLSATIPRGSIYGFLGPNGAGKTTTLRMVMDIIRPDSGRIEVLGGTSAPAAKDRIGYMPEERGLYRKMTAAKVLGYFGSLKGMAKAELARRVPQWLERMGLADRAGMKVEELSRGMHQKLQFAVTAINEPDLLILDEPFSGLDPVNLDLLKDIILGMRREGRTVLFSTHVMHEAERLCDRILLINRGRAVIDGTLAEIRSRWPSDTVSVEAEGDTAFIAALPFVAAVSAEDKWLDVTLAEGADAQQLLEALVGRVRVRALQVKVPSLHEIFIRLVGASDA